MLKKFLLNWLSKLRVSVSRSPDEPQLAGLIARYRPVSLPSGSLVRIGGKSDGGYLVPDCLDQISTCFSPGVDKIAEFELELSTRSIGSHLIDGSINEPPNGFTPISFTEKFLGAVTSGGDITLADWIEKVDKGSDRNRLLQMDIEGAEYSVILSTPEEVLSSFKIIVIELHGLSSLGNIQFFKTFCAFTDKLLLNHSVVHAHPNNILPIRKVSGVDVHPLLELTLLRKDVLSNYSGENCDQEIPHALDADCDTKLPSVVLADIWSKGTSR